MSTRKPKPRKGWTKARRRHFLATIAHKKAARVALESDAASAAADAAEAADVKLDAPRARKAKPKSKPNGNGHADGVDIDARTPRAVHSFPLELIPQMMPLRAATPARLRSAKANSAREFPDNAEGARLAVAMQLLRTIDSLLHCER